MANFAPYVETRTGGWAQERENYESIARDSIVLSYADMSDSDLPESVVPTEWTITEDQSNQGACRGHSLSSGMEQCHVRMGGEIIQLSRACAYYMTQRIDGISGDRGSTIDGGFKLAKQGICLESDWPYPSRYDPRIPAGYENFVKYRIAGHSPINSYDDAIKHLGLVGPVDIGIMWGSEIDQQVSRTGIISTYTGNGGGGHAVLIGGYTSKNWDGSALSEPHLILYNSWSTRWGRQGECLVTKRAFNAMASHRWSVMGGHIPEGHPVIAKPDYGG